MYAYLVEALSFPGFFLRLLCFFVAIPSLHSAMRPRMNDLADYIAYLLSSLGLTVLLVWPQSGPGAWVRERVLRRLLPRRARGVLDCYI